MPRRSTTATTSHASWQNKHETQATYPNAKYVGSERCADCHQHADQVWKKSDHAKAFAALVNAKNPGLRQFDGECIVCHTVGFKNHTGYYDPPPGSAPQKVKAHNDNLINVGCESCHGPGSEHVNNFNDKTIYPSINPFRATEKELNPQTPVNEKNNLVKNRLLSIDGFCQKCHDLENDVHWGQIPFQQKWNMISHPTPKNGVNAAQAKQE